MTIRSRAFVLAGLAAGGLATWTLWPSSWRSGLALGWLLALGLEGVLAARRRAARAAAGPNDLLAVVVLSFLSKLFLIALGGIVGAYSGLFHGPAFVLAFLAAALLGEALVVLDALRKPPRLGRAAAEDRSPS